MEPEAGLSSGFPKLNVPRGAGFLAAGSEVLADDPPKLNDPRGAGVGLEVVSAGLAPKLNPPEAGVDEEAGAGADGAPNENGAAAGLADSLVVSAVFGAPKLNGLGAAVTGVEEPESGADLEPKKFGTAPESLEGADAGAEGLPKPKLIGGFLAASPDGNPPKSGAG